MTEQEKQSLIEIIDSILYGEIVIKKEAGKIVVVKKTESIKLGFILDRGFNGQPFEHKLSK